MRISKPPRTGSSVITSYSIHYTKLYELAKLLEERAEEPDADASRMETISGELTREGKIFGTARYMSPEQARGQSVDHRNNFV